MINFDSTLEDSALIVQIVDRAKAVWPRIKGTRLVMDITAVHLNGCRLKLAELLSADSDSFMHDINGIQRFINRDTGALDPVFCPRFAQPMLSTDALLTSLSIREPDLDLVPDIREHGITRPLTVRRTSDGVVIVDGHRRHAAAKALGIESVPIDEK